MFDFKIWNQANHGTTTGIRVADVNIVAQLGPQFNRCSDGGVDGSSSQYLSAIAVAQTPPDPYRRTVDILWRTAIGYGTHRYFTERVLEATYTGSVRQSGGFAAQCYIIVDPNGFRALGSHHTVPIAVVAVVGTGGQDLLEVTV